MEHHAPSPDIPLSEGGELAADVELIDPHRRSEEELAKISRHIQALSADDTHVLLRRLLEWISSAESQEDTDLLPAEIPDEIDLPHVEAEAPEDPSPSATVSVVLPPAPGATERVLPARTAITRRRRVVPTTRTVDVATPAPPPVLLCF